MAHRYDVKIVHGSTCDRDGKLFRTTGIEVIKAKDGEFVYYDAYARKIKKLERRAKKAEQQYRALYEELKKV